MAVAGPRGQRLRENRKDRVQPAGPPEPCPQTSRRSPCPGEGILSKRPSLLRSTDLKWTGVSPADGAVCRRTPEVPHTGDNGRIACFGAAAGLYFDRGASYIRVSRAAAKSDRAGSP